MTDRLTVAAEITRLERELAHRRELLEMHNATGDRAKAVADRIVIVDLQMCIALRRRELNQ